MAKKSFEGPSGPEDIPTADRFLKVEPEERPTGQEGRVSSRKRAVQLQKQEEVSTASDIRRLREELENPEEKVSGEAKTELQETVLAAEQEAVTGKLSPESQAELIEKSASGEREPVKPIEEKELSEAEVREDFLDALEEKIRLATKKAISPEKQAAIEAAGTFLEKLGLMLEAYDTNQIKSVSYREGIFRVIKGILEEVHRQDAMTTINESEGKLSEKSLQKLEDLEKKYEALQNKIMAYLDVEDSEAASSGVKLGSPEGEAVTEEKFGAPVEENEQIKQERMLADMAINLTERFKGKKLDKEEFDGIVFQDISLGNKIKSLLNQIVGDEKIATSPLRERIKIFMDVSQALSEETAAKMVAAGTGLKEKIGAISTAYNSDSLEIFEHLGLGKRVDDHIEYAEGVNIRFEQ